jgi:hypothetical protein
MRALRGLLIGDIDRAQLRWVKVSPGQTLTLWACLSAALKL